MCISHRTLAFPLLLAASLALGCGKKDTDTSKVNAADTAGSSSSTVAPVPANNSSAPLTPSDIQRWENGIAGELKAVQDAAAKMKTARTGEDSLNAIMGVQEMATIPVGARAAGVDEERYKFIRSNLSTVVTYLTPPELEGMDTTKMPQNLRDEFRAGREAQLHRMAEAVPADVVEALRPRASELRKKDMELVGARLKGAGA
jgi:hypothetical protein